MEHKSLLLIVAGLVIFLYALNHLSDGLRDVAGSRMKDILRKFTGNIIMATITGIFVTILLDSSSAVIIMTIALVNAGVLDFRQAMGIVMGANIGTTISSQIIALNIGEFAAIPIAAGFLLMVIPRRPIVRQIGRIIFSFGLIFFGLFTIEESVTPLKDSQRFVEWLASLKNPVRGMLTGAFVTLIIQSSSATMGMVIGLTAQGLMSLASGIAVMLGAELGTCADTLVATVGRSRNAIRTGVFHLGFNILTILMGLALLPWFTQLVEWISSGQSPSRQIANAHMLFNTLGVLCLLPFAGLMEKAMFKLIPNRPELSGQNPLQNSPESFPSAG
jgi:phosphate:Na+ symporter